jgi:hypothetical protein
VRSTLDCGVGAGIFFSSVVDTSNSAKLLSHHLRSTPLHPILGARKPSAFLHPVNLPDLESSK